MDGSRLIGSVRTPRPLSTLLRGCDDLLGCRACPLPFTCEFGVGAVLLLILESCVSYDADERDAEDREENDTAEVGGDWGGRGTYAGSTFAPPLKGPREL